MRPSRPTPSEPQLSARRRPRSIMTRLAAAVTGALVLASGLVLAGTAAQAAPGDIAIVSPEPDEQFVVETVDDQATVTMSGTGVPGQYVLVTVYTVVDSSRYQDWVKIMEVGPDGTWGETIPWPAHQDTTWKYLMTVQESDSDGVPTGDALERSFTVLADIPVAITSPADQTRVDVTPGGLYSFPVQGTGNPGGTVTVTAGGFTRTTVVRANGEWSTDPFELGVGNYAVEATQQAAQFSSSAAVGLAIWEVDPPGVTPVSIVAPVAGSTLVVRPGGTQDVVVSGNGEPDATVTVTAGGRERTATVAGDGRWSVTFSALPVGEHTITASQVSGSSTTQATTDVTIRAIAPVAITDPTSGATLDLVDGAAATLTVRGTGEPGHVLTVTVGGASEQGVAAAAAAAAVESQTVTVGRDGRWATAPFTVATIGSLAVTAVDGAWDLTDTVDVVARATTAAPGGTGGTGGAGTGAAGSAGTNAGASAGAATAAPKGSVLASTGADGAVALSLVALGLLAAGGGVLLVRARRRSADVR